MRNTFVAALAEGAGENKDVVLLTGDLGFGVFDEFQKKFPRQYINAGLSEPHMTGMAAGFAKEGKTVFTYSIGNFPTLRALEQIRIDVAYHRVPVVIVAIGGGFSYGQLGMSHFAIEDIATMRAMPNMEVYVPGDKWEVTEITKSLLSKPRPAYLRLDKSFAPETHKEGEVLALGKMRTVRDGSDITLIASGGILEEALKAAELLAEKELSVRVMSAHTLKPFDEAGVLAAARDTKAVITVEEHVLQGGLGGAVAETFAKNGILPKKFAMLGLDNEFPTIVGTQQYLREKYGLDANGIARKASELMQTP